MDTQKKSSRLGKFAWFVLGYNILVVVWGVFLRASKSGDGCGRHWLTCHGELIPSAPELKTLIEFSHRIMSGLDFFIVLGLMIWVIRTYQKGEQIRKFAILSFVFIVTEALIGAGLVLTGNTAETYTPYRPIWAIGHLLNTFILIGSLSLTAWLARAGRKFSFADKTKSLWLLGFGILGILFIGASGSLAALSSILFETSSVIEGIRQDFSSASPLLLRLRISHPILSVLIGVGLIFLAGWVAKNSESSLASRWSNAMTILILVQFAFGALTLFMLAPILMQLGHLLLADMVWIAFVLMWACYFQEANVSLTD